MFKDTKQGITHFYGDGCKEHSLDPKIEKELEDILNKWHYEDIRADGVFELSNFISQKLQEAYSAGVKYGRSVAGFHKEVEALRIEEREKVIEEIDDIYYKEQGIHHWQDIKEKLKKNK